MADEKALDLIEVKPIKEGDAAALGGIVMATDEAASATGASKARYYMKMNYQTGQFLRAADFLDEQAYHTRKLRDHNKALHVHGVCEGLIVTGSKYKGCVEVGVGSAIDIKGNSILLEYPEIVDLGAACYDGSVFATTVYLFIRFGEAKATDAPYVVTEGNTTISTRVVERPQFYVCNSIDGRSTDSLNADQLLLAKIERDEKSGEINDPDKDIDSNPPGRRIATVKLQVSTPDDLATNIVQTRHLQNGAVTAEKIAGVVFDSMQLAPGSVTSDKLGPAAVTEGKIGPAAVTETKIDDNAVNEKKIGPAAVTETKIGPSAVTETKIGANAVTEVKIKNDAVTTNKIKDKNITSGKIADGAIKTIHLASGSVSSAEIAQHQINSYHMAVASVNIGAIQTHAVTFDKTNCFMDTTSITVSGRRKESIGFNFIANEIKYPIGVQVYPTSMYFNSTATVIHSVNKVFDMTETDASTVYWYYDLIMYAAGLYTQRVYIWNPNNYAANLTINRWYWKHYEKIK